MITPEQRQQAALAEYNLFVAQLQERYGVLVRPCLMTTDFGDGSPRQQLGVSIDALSNWQPPEQPGEANKTE